MPLKFLLPVYWPLWVLLGILRLIALLPLPQLTRAGAALGWIGRHIPFLRFPHIARCNLKLCLPELTDAERERILDDHFKAVGICLCESAMSWWRSDASIREFSQIQGLEHLQQALARGKGAIVLTAHFTTLEISARILNTAVPLSALYRPPKNALLNWFSVRQRTRLAQRSILHDDIRGMVRALRDNHCVWYAPDQAYRKKGAEMVKFFGVPAATNVSTSRLAKMTGAAVLYFAHERLDYGRGYRVSISPILEDFPGPSAIGDAERFNHFIESEVRRIPAQYWWIHRRFKGLTSDYPNYYAAKS